LQIVTLRTMHNALTAMLVRVHDAAKLMAISPAFKADEGNSNDAADALASDVLSPRISSSTCSATGDAGKSDQMGPKELEEGSTARAVAGAAGLFSKELLDMVQALQQLQQQLDQQEEGCAPLCHVTCSVTCSAATGHFDARAVWSTPQIVQTGLHYLR
jgi:hypothetical protein